MQNGGLRPPVRSSTNVRSEALSLATTRDRIPMTMFSLRMLRRAIAVLACAIASALPAIALADDDLPGRVGRVAEFAGELFLAPQDKPDQWIPIGLNYPVTSGDNLWAGREGRAEIDFGAGQFRLAGDTNLHISRLDDRQFALFVAQGRVNVRVRVLEPGEVAQIASTANAKRVGCKSFNAVLRGCEGTMQRTNPTYADESATAGSFFYA